jgi:hypothetical protein
MSDDKSVLGNLPRSRPGRRSEKRGGRPADAAERAADRSEGRSAPSAMPPSAAARSKAGPAQRQAKPAPPPPPAPAAGDPIGEAARATAKLVGAGVRVGTGIAQEVLRRLPRP